MGKDECKLFDISNLHTAWLALKQRICSGSSTVLSCLTLVKRGELVNKPFDVASAELQEYIANYFLILDSFELGIDYLRAKYLFPLKRQRALAATQPAVGHVLDEKQAPAIGLLRLWATATNSEARSAIYRKAVYLLTGQQSIEDESVAIKKKHPKSRQPSFHREQNQRDYLRYQDYYYQNISKSEIILSTWQDFDPVKVSLKPDSKADHRGICGQVDLVFADPFYGEKFQPTLTEMPRLRKLFDLVSKDYTVFLIFGRPDMLYTKWAPVFERGLGGSKVDYTIQSSLFHVVRSSRRDNFTHNYVTWHSMCEDALTVVRQPARKATATKDAVAERVTIFH